MVTIEYKNDRRKCEFFVVLSNGQVLLGMPDTAALKIININIDSLEAEDTKKTIATQTQKPPRFQMPSRKCMGLESAVQTQMAFSKLTTITVGQPLILMQTP